MQKFCRILSFMLCAILMLSACAVPVFAEFSSKESVRKDSDITVKACANKGDWSSFPENSLQAVASSTSEYVSVDVKVTKDGVPVLMEDETVERTCVDKNGKTAKGRVSDYTLKEIQQLYLRSKNGGPHNEKTDNRVPTLNEVLSKAADKTIVLDFGLNDLDAVYDNIISASDVIFRIDGKTDEIMKALNKKENVPETILKYDGNIIFGVNNTIKSAKESGLNMVQTGSKNQYGVIFYGSVKNKIRKNKLIAAFSMTDGFSAKRSDTVSGWDDVISHGYSFIETDYPDLLNAYISESESLRQRLIELTASEGEYKDGAYPKNLMEEYNKAYSEAKAVAESVASQSQLAEAYTRLNNACRALNVAEGTSTHQSVLNFSVGRIIAAVLCLAAVIAAQIFFYKRRK